jgi:hypothetical protein
MTNAEITESEEEYSARIRNFIRDLPQLRDLWVIDADGHPLVAGTVYPMPRNLMLADRKGLEHLDGVFLHRADSALQPVGRVGNMLVVGNPPGDRENDERQDKRRRDQQAKRAFRAAIGRSGGGLLRSGSEFGHLAGRPERTRDLLVTSCHRKLNHGTFLRA